MSGDLLETTRILFDADGQLRDFAGAAGSDLLYFTSLSVEDGHDFFKVAVELLEHVIEQYGGGCFGAAYYRDEMPRLEFGAGAPAPRVRSGRGRAAVLRKPGASTAGVAA